MANQDSHVKSVFKEPPLIAYQKNLNMRSYLIWAKLADKKSNYPKRYLKGMKKCGQECTACPYIEQGRDTQINQSTWNINKQLNCGLYNVVYAIICTKHK